MGDMTWTLRMLVVTFLMVLIRIGDVLWPEPATWDQVWHWAATGAVCTLVVSYVEQRGWL